MVAHVSDECCVVGCELDNGERFVVVFKEEDYCAALRAILKWHYMDGLPGKAARQMGERVRRLCRKGKQ